MLKSNYLTKSSRKSSTVKFCPECNNMLYPKEQKDAKKLVFACHNCDHQEDTDQSLVYQHNIIPRQIERKHAVSGLASDPTLPHTNKKPCPKCSSSDLVFFQTHDRRRDTPMNLNFVCCNSTCSFTWTEGRI